MRTSRTPRAEGPRTDPSYEKWKSLQSHWDDDEFLASLTPLMRLRYRRLSERVEAVLGEAFQGAQGRPLLLDVGCGRGEFAAYLAQGGRGKDWDYLGIEPSREQLARRDIREFGRGFLQALGERLPIPDMAAQGVLVKEALDHCFDPGKVLAEAKRVLKPGGVLVVTVTNDRSYFKRLLPWVNRARKAAQEDHLSFFGPEDLARLAEGASFDRVRAETYNYLKLPRFMERVLGSFGEGVCRSLLRAADSIGGALLPGLGGGIILTARRKF